MTDNTKKLFNADCNVINLEELKKGRSGPVKALKASIKAAHAVFTSKEVDAIERNKATSILNMFIVMTTNLVTMIDQSVADEVGCKREYIVGVRSLAKHIIDDDGTKVDATPPLGTKDAVGINNLEGVLEGFENGTFSVWKNRNTYKKEKGPSTANPQKALASALKKHGHETLNADADDIAKMLVEGTSPFELVNLAASKIENPEELVTTVSGVLGEVIATMKAKGSTVSTEKLTLLYTTCEMACDVIDEVFAGRQAKSNGESDELGVDLATVTPTDETEAVQELVN